MKKLTTFLGILGVLAITPLANADIQLSYQVTGFAATTCATTVSASPTTSASCLTAVGGTNVGGGVVLFNFGGNGLQLASASEEFGAVTTIQNTDTVSHTLTLWIADQNFTKPVAPPGFNWSSNLQFTSTTGTGTVTMMSCLDTANALAPPTTAFCGGAGSPTLTNGLLNYSGVSTPPTDTVSTSVATLGVPWSMGEKITLVLGAGTALNINTSQILTQVPEPMSIALLGGVLLVTAGAIRRKRGQARS